MKIRLCKDYIRIQLEPEKRCTQSGLYLTGPEPVRIATVLQVGPGRVTKKGKRLPMSVKPGDRIPFFKAVTETKQGRALAEKLPEDQDIIQESDVLFVLEGDVKVTV